MKGRTLRDEKKPKNGLLGKESRKISIQAFVENKKDGHGWKPYVSEGEGKRKGRAGATRSFTWKAEPQTNRQVRSGFP